MDTLLHKPSRTTVVYAAFSLVLMGYVALCTPNRDSSWGADAWEHHRAIVALTENLWHPGNPTFATAEPSVRYSPYTVLIALVCRGTDMDPYTALSAAAVVNTGLFCAGLYLLLRVYGMTVIAPYALLVLMAFYGEAPGYANTYALSDLPWHQVNPSAWVIAWVLIVWAGLRYTADHPRAMAVVVSFIGIGAMGLLTHAHTMVLGFLGMFSIALTVPAQLRWRVLRRVCLIGVGTFLLSLAWPWFSFIRAVLTTPDPAYWYNVFTLKEMLLVWCAPALLMFPLLLSLRRYELVRFCLLGAAISYGLAISSVVTRSSVLSRLPLPSLVLLDIPIAVFIHEYRLFHPATWRNLARELWNPDAAHVGWAFARVSVIVLFVYGLVPQLAAIPRDPLLARAYLAPLLHKEDKQLRLKTRFDDLLKPVGGHDVVLSDLITSWPLASSRGRVVAALHYEIFTPDQPTRQADCGDFFTTTDETRRDRILDEYAVRWIVLNPEWLDRSTYTSLLEPRAVVKRVGDMVLMDAQRWRSVRNVRQSSQQVFAGATR